MEFKQSFLKALQSNTKLTKTISLDNYFPHFTTPWEEAIDNLPYVQAFGHIHALFPYYYEISQLSSFCCLYTESGSGSYIFDKDSQILSSGTLLLIDCMEPHRIEIKQSPWIYKVFYMNGPLLPYLYQKIVAQQGNLIYMEKDSKIPIFLQQLYKYLSWDTYYYRLKSSKLILDILFEIMLEQNRTGSPYIPNYLREIKEVFDQHYQEVFSLEALEGKYHISKYRICREFTQFFGISPMRYLNNKRIEVAKYALTHSDKKIHEIGRMVGYENTNHLIRQFKKKTGLTPLVYRKQTPVTND